MGRSTEKTPAFKSGSTTDNTFVVLQTIGDTTWRMFVPSVGFTLFGVWLDTVWGTKPWLMALGIGVGLVGAYLLVAEQFKRIKRSGQ